MAPIKNSILAWIVQKNQGRIDDDISTLRLSGRNYADDQIMLGENIKSRIALPLTTQENRVFLYRGGRYIEAWRDHLPGTLTDHTTVFGGFVVKRDDITLAVSCPDVYLIQLKSLKYEPVVLMCDSIRAIRDFDLFSWPICTQWNCNFFSRESNHLHLRYTIQWEKEISLASALEK